MGRTSVSAPSLGVRRGRRGRGAPTRETEKRGGRERGGARARTESTHVGRSCVPASSLTSSRGLTPPCRASGASGSERRTRSLGGVRRLDLFILGGSPTSLARFVRFGRKGIFFSTRELTTRRPRGAPTRPRGSCFPRWSRGARGPRTPPRRKSPRTWTAPAWMTSLAPPRARIRSEKSSFPR